MKKRCIRESRIQIKKNFYFSNSIERKGSVSRRERHLVRPTRGKLSSWLANRWRHVAKFRTICQQHTRRFLLVIEDDQYRWRVVGRRASQRAAGEAPRLRSCSPTQARPNPRTNFTFDMCDYLAREREGEGLLDRIFPSSFLQYLRLPLFQTNLSNGGEKNYIFPSVPCIFIIALLSKCVFKIENNKRERKVKFIYFLSTRRLSLSRLGEGPFLPLYTHTHTSLS